MAETKYGYLIKRMNIRDTQRKTGGNADHIGGFGGKDLEGLSLNFTWAIHRGLGDWHEGRDPHVHTYDECLIFVGLDPENPDYLGAEIEISMGEEGEKQIINTPATVVIPAGLVHGPLITKKVDQAYGFSAICLSGEHTTTWLGTGKVTE